MEDLKNNKRVLNIELDNNVKKVSITGTDGDEKMVMSQELDENDLKLATGGGAASNRIPEILKETIGEYVGQHPEFQIFL